MWDLFDRVLRTLEEQLAAIWRAVYASILVPIGKLVAGAGRFIFRVLIPGIVLPVSRLLREAWLQIFLRPTSDVFYVTGRRLRDNDRVPVTLRGVNLPLLDDWDFPASDRLAEVEKSGANAVRIQWYAQYPDPARPAYSITHLDAFLDRCRLHRMIPILELHDCTCQGDPQLVNIQLIPWWTRADVVKVLRRHERYLIINLANELGEYRFGGATPAALDAFKNAYKQAISSIRAQGLRMPIMIDAPDCGTSLHALVSIGHELINHDPRRSLLMSAHAYWAGWDGTAHVTGPRSTLICRS